MYLKLYYCPITINHTQTTDDHFYGFSSRHITSFEVAAFRCSVMSMYIYLTSCYLLLLVTLPHEAAMRYIPSVRPSVPCYLLIVSDPPLGGCYALHPICLSICRDQPNSREKMRNFMVEFLKCAKFHGKFTGPTAVIRGAVLMQSKKSVE